MRLKRAKLLGMPLLVLAALLPGCTAVQATTTPLATSYTLSQLKYILLAEFPDYFWCDPDYYPVAREGGEQQNALAEFPAIQADAEEFAAILQHTGLAAQASYSDADKLTIYREHKKLTYVIQMTQINGGYDFTLRTGQGQGWQYNGSITTGGAVIVATKVPSYNTCPICLTRDTLIDTPAGQVPVQELTVGTLVWTIDASGRRVAAPILRTAATAVPLDWMVVRLTLADGRSVTASPGHPSAAGRALGDYQAGDMLDGSVVVSAEHIAYAQGFTYDILPDSATGFYWANGVLLGSTLK